MAGFDPSVLLTGQPTLTQASSSGSGMGGAGGYDSGYGGGTTTAAPHIGLVSLVAIAVIGLLLLDKAGFKFAVSVGAR